jgi:hypothetical protein
MEKFYGKTKIRGIDVTINENGVSIFDKNKEVEKEDSWKICKYLTDEGYIDGEAPVKVSIIRSLPR